ncbi:MAG: T9SS type A sorting domain-containing protein [Saprospiraceae bacterium]|nr:T9SS type A sorting domain-containing protein [Saprospiraceae bacterium]
MQIVTQRIKVIFLCVVMSLLSVIGNAQGIKTSRIRIYLDSVGSEKLLRSGLDLSHAFHEKGKYLESDFTSGEIAMLERESIPFKVLIDDVTQYYVERSTNPDFIDEFAVVSSRSEDECDHNRTKIIGDQPVNFELGSMIGFHRYFEILSELDQMREMYPQFITEKSPVGNFRTFKGRPIYHLVISNPIHQTQLPKPKILYTALHHAREPISVTQLMYFMWYVLENYEKNDLIRSIVDNYELYFIPIVNPDGYVYNEEIAPQGGGSHRKNIKSYEIFKFGVDLNRNYHYNWGLDTIGSSTDHSHEEYRGPFSGSESEVRAVMHLCESVPFDIALNHHAFGNVLLYPWGFTREPVEDIRTFRELGQEMLRDNSMFAGLVNISKTIGYFTNGSSDDWMYGEQDIKNKIYAFTPEIGQVNDGFWPQINRIIPLCKEMLHTNIVSAAILGNYALLSDDGPDYAHDLNYKFPFNIKRLGLKGGTFKVSIKAVSPNIVSVDPQKTIVLEMHESKIGEIGLYLSNTIQDFDEIKFVVELDNGLYINRDTITKIFLSEAREIFADNAGNLDNWNLDNSGYWQLNDEDAFSAPFSFSHTIAEPYRSEENSSMTLKEPIDLRNAQAAYVTFKTKFVIEPKHDYANISASPTGFQFQPLCGKRSKLSLKTGKPVYDGFKYNWVIETVDLKDYLGSEIYLRIAFEADDEAEFEGLSFDDFRVIVVNDPLLDSEEADTQKADFVIFPNPSSGQLFYRLQHTLSGSEVYRLRIYNMVGQLVHSENVQAGTNQSRLFSPVLNPGIYTYQLMGEHTILSSGKFIIR